MHCAMRPGNELNRHIQVAVSLCSLFRDQKWLPTHPRRRAAVGGTSRSERNLIHRIYAVLHKMLLEVASKLVALKSLGHWVGDIHQPLHVSILDDKGGNTIRTSGQCAGNLHAVWDTCLVQYAIGPDASEAVTDLLAAITPEMKAQWNASVPRDWANESFAIAGGGPNDVLPHARIVVRPSG